MTHAQLSTPPRKTLEAQLAAQGGTLADGEVAIRYRDLNQLYAALQRLAAKTLPTKEARIHVARCMRSLKDHLDDYGDEQRRIVGERAPEDASDGFVSAAAIAISREVQALGALVACVKMPKKITAAMLPENSKTSPDNEVGVAAIMTDLAPYLYDIPEE